MPGRFLRRINRFVAEVEIDGERVEAHVPNSGRLTQLAVSGNPVLLGEVDSPARKTRYDWILARAPGGGWALVDSRIPGRVFSGALAHRPPGEFAGYPSVAREVSRGGSRLDFLLEDDAGKRCWIEMKSVTLAYALPWGVEARFPDAPTTRGRRHLRELVEARRTGDRAAVVFAVGRPDALFFGANPAIDQAFSRALWEASLAGVEIYAYGLECHPARGVRLARRIPVHLNGPKG